MGEEPFPAVWIESRKPQLTGILRMLPTLQNDVPVSRDVQALSEQVLPHDAPASWSQWHITGLPPEVLSHIFSFLDCDNIVRVNDTCQAFRKVVKAHHPQALLFSRFPQLFRKQTPQSRLWLKQMVDDGLHPFTRPLAGERQFLNAEQQAAALCLHTLRTMMSTPVYHPMEVITSNVGFQSIGIIFAKTNSNLSIYFPNADAVWLMGQNDAGLWSDQKIELNGPHRETSLSIARCFRGSFSPDGRYYSVLGFNDIQIYKHESGTWQLVNRQQLGAVDRLQVSSSGKYLVVSSRFDGIESIRYFDEQKCWNPMPLAIETNTRVEQVEFSSSEQHLLVRCIKKMEILSLDSQGCWNSSWKTTLPRRIKRVFVQFSPSEQLIAIRYKKKVMVLSLNSRGCWNTSWETPLNQKIRYIKFCPSGSRLLMAYCATDECEAFAEMIELDRAGNCLFRQVIALQNLEFTFSPGGNYLFAKKESEQYLLWGLLKSGRWASYGDLTDRGAPLWPGPGQAKPELSTIAFSSCDNYLFTSTADGAVKIWEQVEQRCWVVRGSEQCDSVVYFVQFSQSGIHALAKSSQSVRIWGRDDSGLWSVKGTIPATGVMIVDFHPVAEHLIFLWCASGIQIWELRKCFEPEVPQGGTTC